MPMNPCVKKRGSEKNLLQMEAFLKSFLFPFYKTYRMGRSTPLLDFVSWIFNQRIKFYVEPLIEPLSILQLMYFFKELYICTRFIIFLLVASHGTVVMGKSFLEIFIVSLTTTTTTTLW